MYRTLERVEDIGEKITSQATGAKKFAQRGITAIGDSSGVKAVQSFGTKAATRLNLPKLPKLPTATNVKDYINKKIELEKNGMKLGATETVEYIKPTVKKTVEGVQYIGQVTGATDAGKYVGEGVYKTTKAALEGTAETIHLVEDIALDTIETNTFKRTSDYFKKIPTFYKLLFLVLFYLFFYKIFYDIGRYIGLNSLELILYMFWFGILILLLAFLTPSRSRLYS